MFYNRFHQAHIIMQQRGSGGGGSPFEGGGGRHFLKLCTSNPSLECSCRYVILTPFSSFKRLECNISSLPFNFFVSIQSSSTSLLAVIQFQNISYICQEKATESTNIIHAQKSVVSICDEMCKIFKTKSRFIRK